MSTSYDQILKDLKGGKVAPVYLLHGEESYFIDKITDWAESNLLSPAEQSFNQQVFYGKDADVQQVVSACQRFPLMASRQVIVIREAQLMKDIAALEKYVEKPVPSTVLVIAHKHKPFDKRTKAFKTFEKHAVIFESKAIKEARAGEFIMEEAKAKGITLTPQAVALMTAYHGTDLYQIANTLDKLGIALPGSEIGENEVKQHAGISKEYNPFELVNALGAGRTQQVVDILAYLRSHMKENPFPLIVTSLFNFYSKVYTIWADKLGTKEQLKSIGVYEFVQREYIAAANRLGSTLPTILDIVFSYELKFKGVGSQGVSDADLLTEMVMKILHARPEMEIEIPVE